MTKDKTISLKNRFALYTEGLINSFSQVFFSNNRWFAFIIILVTFLDFGAGISGIIAVITGQILARFFNFNLELIRDGTYTYNSLTVGIALGIFYEFNLSYFILLVIVSALTFFVSVWYVSSLGKRGLPLLSIPFLLVLWIVILGANNFNALVLNEKEILSIEKYFPFIFSNVNEWVDNFPLANLFHLFFRSLGAILFQFNDLAGILLSIGLLIYSRMAFLLSVLGFLVGYAFYYFLGGDYSQLIYSYIGFNFILTAIALGGFFIVPSKKSYFLLLLTIPIIALLISALHTLFTTKFGLPLYSLPFNIVVLLFLGTLYNRTKVSGIEMVRLQLFSPEKHYYKHHDAKERFGKYTYFNIALPFFGEWHIPQGHEGEITHKGDWKYAWDFDIVNEMGVTYKNLGTELKDYYCYDLPVCAPESGYVSTVVDGIEDNMIGEVDLENNWGNTVVIKHGEYFYSKLSHLKKFTLKVKEGDYVKKGDIIGYCGSSGRSPEPHLHFQLQSTPFVGSKTLPYPIANYILRKGEQFFFKEYSIPEEGDFVSNVSPTPLLQKAFDFIPGKEFSINSNRNGKQRILKWEVFTTAYNQTYIYCHTTKSTLYFVNNKTLFYATDFYGDTDSELYLFYLGLHKVLLSFVKNLKVEDLLPIDYFFSKPTLFVHDFVAPFYHFCNAFYTLNFKEIDDTHNPKEIVFQTVGTGKRKTTGTKKLMTNVTVKNNEIQECVFTTENEKIILQWKLDIES